jgi:hypothetical protein
MSLPNHFDAFRSNLFKALGIARLPSLDEPTVNASAKRPNAVSGQKLMKNVKN